MSKCVRTLLLMAILAESALIGFAFSAHTDGQLPKPAGSVPLPRFSAQWWTLHTHDLVGTVVLIAGALALISRKGGKLHRRAGWTYVLSMGALAISVVPMFVISPSSLQLALTALSTYLVVSATLIVRNRMNNSVSFADLCTENLQQRLCTLPVNVFLQVAAALSLVAFSLAALLPAGQMSWTASYADIPANLLALLGLALACSDILIIAGGGGSRRREARVKRHAVRMLGSFLILLGAGFFNICASFHLLDETLRWLIPPTAATFALLLLTPLLTRAAHRHLPGNP